MTDSLDDTQYEANKVLSLTRNEALFLDDSFSMILERDSDEEDFNRGKTVFPFIPTVRPLTPTGGLPAPSDLLEKIGHAILYTTDTDNLGKQAEILVSLTDLYMLRELAQSFVKVGEEKVGYNLKRKIHSLLFQESYELNRTAESILQQVDADVFTEWTDKH